MIGEGLVFPALGAKIEMEKGGNLGNSIPFPYRAASQMDQVRDMATALTWERLASLFPSPVTHPADRITATTNMAIFFIVLLPAISILPLHVTASFKGSHICPSIDSNPCNLRNLWTKAFPYPEVSIYRHFP